MNGTSRRVAWAALPALLTVLLSGCSSDNGDKPGEGPIVDSQGSETALQPAHDKLVRAVELRPEDLPGDYGANQMEDGDLVEGEVTLDMCGATFPSEDLRTARHQVAYLGPGDSISSETVTYEPGGAEQAMGELRDAVAQCPKGFIEGPPTYKVKISPLPVESDWQADTIAMRVTFTPKEGRRWRSSGAAIYQRLDDAITAVYVFAGPETSAELAAGFASLLSERLEVAVAGKAS